MNTSRLASSLLLSLSLAACGGPASNDAKFSVATDAQISRSFQAASGGDASSALLIGLFLAGGNDQTACPRSSTTGNETILLGGCTDPSSNQTWEGKVVITNAQGIFTQNPAYDPSQPTTVAYVGLDVTGTDDNGQPMELKIDGTVDATNSVDGSMGTLDTDDLVLTYQGVEIANVLHLSANAKGVISPADESSISITGLGDATIEGQWTLNDPLGGVLTLHGEDDLVFDLDHANADTQCVPYSGAKTGQACPQQ